MDNNWDDIWERRRDPHPCIKIYLKVRPFLYFLFFLLNKKLARKHVLT